MHKSIVKPTIIITILRLVSVIFGFGTQKLLGFYFGTSDEMSAYFAAFVIPQFIAGIFLSRLNILFVPILVESENKADNNTWKFISKILIVNVLMLSVVALIVFAFAPILTTKLYPDLSQEQIQTCIMVLRFFAVSIIFSGINGLLGSIYFAQHKFILPVLLYAMLPLINITFLLVLERHIGIYSMALAYVVGLMMQTVILLPILKDKFYFTLDLVSKDVWDFLKLYFPLILSGLLMHIGIVIESSVASTLSSKTISHIGYSRRLVTILFTVYAGGLAITITPVLSRYWSEKNITKLKETFSKGYVLMAFLGVFIAALVFYCRHVIVQIIWQGGTFTANDTIEVANTLAWFLPYLILFGISNVLSRGLYVVKKTKTLLLISTIDLLAYVVSLLLLVPLLGRAGLILSNTVRFIVFVGLLFIFVSRYTKAIDFKYVMMSSSKIAGVLLCSCSLVYMFGYFNTLGNIYINAIISSFLLTISFAILSIYVFKIPEAVDIFHKILKKVPVLSRVT